MWATNPPCGLLPITVNQDTFIPLKKQNKTSLWSRLYTRRACRAGVFPALVLLSLFMLTACTPRLARVLIDLRDTNSSGRTVQSGAHISDVPFYSQKKYMCGPAALTSLLNYYGVNKTLAEVEEGIYIERLKGTITMDMLLYAKDAGLSARFYQGSLADIKQHLDDRQPLILFLSLGVEGYSVGHYIVVTGYSDKYGVVIAHSGQRMDKVINYGQLTRDWEKTGRSTLLITKRKRK